MTTSKDTPRRATKARPINLTAAKRRADAVRLRIEGHTFEQIARKVGYSDKAAAFKAVQAARKEILREPTEELVGLEVDRLESLIAETWTVINEARSAGELELLLKAIDRGAKLSESRRKLLGLDAPARSDVTSGGETLVVFHPTLNPDQP